MTEGKEAGTEVEEEGGEEDDFEIDLDMMDTEQVLVTNQNPKPNQIGANFVLDLGATKHIITKKEYFTSYKDSYGKLGWGTDASIDSIRIGNVKLVNKGNKIVLENCLYVPNFCQ